MPDLLRRRLMMVMALAPLLPQWKSSASTTVPHQARIISLEWLPTELLLTLGVTPLGCAEINNYHKWVAEPAIPPTTVDVGLRTEPNLELIMQLQPSLLLLSQGFGPAPARLATIAPCLAFPFTDTVGKPLTVARHSLMQLAERIDRVPQAQRHLLRFDAFMADSSKRLVSWIKKPLLLMSILDSGHALVFGRGSLFVEVLETMGFQSAWQGETNFWGSAVVGIEQLAELQEAEAICFDHGNQLLMKQVMTSPLWQALPFVRAGAFHQAPAVWFFGATLSVMRFCQILEDVLEE